MPSLTVTGGVFFDADRALGVQGDGRTTDSSASIFEATTNLENSAGADVSFESGTAGYTTGGTNTIAASAEQFKFGAKSCKATYQDNATLLDIALTLTAAAQSASRWLYIPAAYDGGGISVQFSGFVGATGTLAVAANMALRDQWQRVEVPNVTIAGGDLIGNVQVVNTGAAPTAGRFVYIDGAQTETQPLCTPFTISPRTAARVQAPASLLDATQGWVAMRVRMGWASTSAPDTAEAYGFVFYDTSSNGFLLTWRQLNASWDARRESTTATLQLLVADSFSKGDVVTLIYAWTATQIKLSVDGAAFSAQANTEIPVVAASTFDIGSDAGSAQIDSDIFWFACGTGTLTDTEAAAIHAFGNTDKAPEDFIAVAPACACTAVMPMDTAAYLDEAFTIIDPDNTGASRGILPHLRVDIDFANNPTSSTRTWTDVSGYVKEFATQRGRADALSRPDTGTLALTLQNTDGRFDPTNTSGPYYPNVLPMRRVRVRARWNLVDYNLFHGYVDDWPLSFPDLNKNAIVQVKAVDALAILPLFDLGGQSYASQRSDVRGSAVLAACGFGTAETNLATGESTMAASGTISAGVTAQSHLLDVQASENGLLFADAGGTLVFHDRHFRATDRATSSGTVGTGAGLIGYREIRTSYGLSDLWNTVTVTANGGTAETAADAASTASYYKRSLTWPVGGSYLVSSQAEALSAAQYIVGLYSQPALRVPEVATVGAAGTANWATILGLEISSRITLAHVTPAGGTIAGDKFVEGIGHHVTFTHDWQTPLRLSDAPAQAMWVLGDAVNSLLGQTTVQTY